MQNINNIPTTFKNFIHATLTPNHLAEKITNFFFVIIGGYNLLTYYYPKFRATPLSLNSLSSTEKIEIQKLIHENNPDSLKKASEKLEGKIDNYLWEKLLLNVLVALGSEVLKDYLRKSPLSSQPHIYKKLGLLSQVLKKDKFSKQCVKILEELEIRHLMEQEVSPLSKVEQLMKKCENYSNEEIRYNLFRSLYNLFENANEDPSALKKIEIFLKIEMKTLSDIEKELSSIKNMVDTTPIRSKLEKKLKIIQKNKRIVANLIKTINNKEKISKSELPLLFNQFAIKYIPLHQEKFNPQIFYEKAKNFIQNLAEFGEVEARVKLENYLLIAQFQKKIIVDSDIRSKIRELCGRVIKKDYAINLIRYFVKISNEFKADNLEEETESKEWILDLACKAAKDAPPPFPFTHHQLEDLILLRKALKKTGTRNFQMNSISLKIEENYQSIQLTNKQEFKEKITLLFRYFDDSLDNENFDLSRPDKAIKFYEYVSSNKFFKDLPVIEQVQFWLQIIEIFSKNYKIDLLLTFIPPIFDSIKISNPKTFDECKIMMQFIQKIILLDLNSPNIPSITELHSDMTALADSRTLMKDRVELYRDLFTFYTKNSKLVKLQPFWNMVLIKFSHINRNSLFTTLPPREKVVHLEKIYEIFLENRCKGSAIKSLEETFDEAKNIEDPLSFGSSHVEPKSDIYIRLAKRMNLLKMDIDPIVTAICEVQYNTEQVDLEVFHLCRALEELDKIIEDENKGTLQKPLLEKVEVRLKEAVEKAITLTEIEKVLDGYKTFTNTLIELAPERSVYDSDVQNPYESYGTLPFGSIFRALNNLPQENIAKITELKSKAILLSPEANRREQFEGLLKEVINHQTKTLEDVESKYNALSTLFALCFDINCLDVFLQSSLFSDSYFEAISKYEMKSMFEGFINLYEAGKMKVFLLTISKTFKEKCSNERYFFSSAEMYEVSNLFKKFEKLDLTPLALAEAYVAFGENIEGLATVDQLLDILKKIHSHLMLIAAGQEFNNLMEKVNRLEIQLDLLKQQELINNSTSSSREDSLQISSTDEEPSSYSVNDSFVVTNDPVLLEKLKISAEVISPNKVKYEAIRFVASWALARLMVKTTINFACRFFTLINSTSVNGYKRLSGLYAK